MKRTISTLLALTLSSPALLAQTAPSNTTPTQTVTASPGEDSTEAAQPGVSEVRIVRLSQATGDVKMDRNTGLGFEAAFTNLPIIQGAKLQTGEGAAEVEFEDSSTLRLTPDTVVEFTELNRTATGSTNSGIKVLKGTVYVSLEKTKGNSFTLTCERGKITLKPDTHVRLYVGVPQTELAVAHGSAQFKSPSSLLTIDKNKGMLFDTATQTTPTLLTENEDAPFDEWDKHQDEYHKRNLNRSALAGSGYMYGASDLNYYGHFTNLDGCGRVWQPYFVSAAWDPYANGIWAWYPGSGYSWVSPYPWGWAPFHYGSWMQCSSGGWGWAPGGSWSGLHNTHFPHHDHDPDHRRHVHPYPPRPRPPVPGHATFVAVNTKPLTFSRVSPVTNNFVFHNDSAGLGVPRDAFGKLGKTAAAVEHNGYASVRVYPVNPPDHLAQPNRDYGHSDQAAIGHNPTQPGHDTSNSVRSGAAGTSAHTGETANAWHPGTGATSTHSGENANAWHPGAGGNSSHSGDSASSWHPGAGSSSSSSWHPGDGASHGGSAGASGGAPSHQGSYGGGGSSGASSSHQGSFGGGGSYGGGGNSGGGGSHSYSPPPSAPAPAPAPSAPSAPAPSAPAGHR